MRREALASVRGGPRRLQRINRPAPRRRQAGSFAVREREFFKARAAARRAWRERQAGSQGAASECRRISVMNDEVVIEVIAPAEALITDRDPCAWPPSPAPGLARSRLEHDPATHRRFASAASTARAVACRSGCAQAPVAPAASARCGRCRRADGGAHGREAQACDAARDTPDLRSLRTVGISHFNSACSPFPPVFSPHLPGGR